MGSPAVTPQFEIEPPSRPKQPPQYEIEAPDPHATTPLNQQGAFRRFTERFLGLPDDLFDNPMGRINPFSKENAERRRAFEAGETPDEATGLYLPRKGESMWDAAKRTAANRSNAELIPGYQAYRDFKAGNLAGAIGDVLPAALMASQIAAPVAGRFLSSPAAETMIPRIGRWTGAGVGYEAGKGVGHPGIGAAAGATTGEIAGRGLVKMGQRVSPFLTRSGVGSIPFGREPMPLGEYEPVQQTPEYRPTTAQERIANQLFTEEPNVPRGTLSGEPGVKPYPRMDTAYSRTVIGREPQLLPASNWRNDLAEPPVRLLPGEVEAKPGYMGEPKKPGGSLFGGTGTRPPVNEAVPVRPANPLLVGDTPVAPDADLEEALKRSLETLGQTKSRR